MLKTIKLMTATAVLSLAVNVVHATDSDFQTWGNITAVGSLDVIKPELKPFKYWLEGQGRFGNDVSVFSQGIIRTGLGYSVTDKISVWLGYAFIETDEPFTKTPFGENRIWQQVLWTEKLGSVSFTSRSRLEQRFIGQTIPTGEDVGWRFRQMLKLSVPIPSLTDFSFVVSDEYFVHINDTNWKAVSGFDQNRVFAGIGYNFNKNIKTEIGYMNQYINRMAPPHRVTDILSINLFLNY